MQMNRLQDLTPAPSMTVPIEHSSRPTLGFPLGTALLLLVIFSLSGMFSCCYHWDKLRSLLRSRHPAMFQEGEHTVISIGSSPSKTASDHKVAAPSAQYLILTSSRIPGIFISCKLQLRIILYVCVVCSWRKWGKSVVCLLLCLGTRSPNSLRGPGHTSCVCLKQRRLKLRWKPNVRVMRPFVSVHQYMKAHLAVSDL